MDGLGMDGWMGGKGKAFGAGDDLIWFEGDDGKGGWLPTIITCGGGLVSVRRFRLSR